MAAQLFVLPDLGEGLTEAVIVRWLVNVGDTVTVDQAVAEVETAKNVIELPTPYAGIVLALHGAEGEAIATGAPVLEVDETQHPLSAAPQRPTGDPATVAETTASDSAIEAYRREERAGASPGTQRSGNVLVGYGTATPQTKKRRRRPRERDTVADTMLRAPQGTAHPSRAASGLAGITVSAVEQFSPLQKTAAEHLSRSRREIPEATVWVDVDFTELWQLRARLAADGKHAPSITVFVAHCALRALREYPLLAARIGDDGQTLLRFDGVNLGVAVNAERGLIVPTLARADQLTVEELDARVRQLIADARHGTAASQHGGSTFTFNNYGGLGVDGAAAIINHPEVALLGLGRIIERPWVCDGEITVRRIGQLSLVFDHRVCDGGYVSGFLKLVVSAIEGGVFGYIVNRTVAAAPLVDAP